MTKIAQLASMLVFASGLWFARSDLLSIKTLRAEVSQELTAKTIQVTDDPKDWLDMAAASEGETILFLEGWDGLSDSTLRWLDQHRSHLQVGGRLVIVLTDATLARVQRLAPHLSDLVQPLGIADSVHPSSGLAEAMSVIAATGVLAINPEDDALIDAMAQRRMAGWTSRPLARRKNG